MESNPEITNDTPERDILNIVWEGLAKFGSVMFRNNVGAFKPGYVVKRFIRFGLFKGSGDLIGWTSVEVTQDMVGKKVAIFTSVETKTLKGKARKDQLYWIGRVKGDGGYAGVARGLEDAQRIVEGG